MGRFESLYIFSAMVTPFLIWFVGAAVIAITAQNALWRAIAITMLIFGFLTLHGFSEYYKHKDYVLILVRKEDLPKIARALEDQNVK